MGADPNVRLGKDSETLLHVAIREGRKEIVRMLLNAKAKPDEPLKDGVTPLMMAVENDNADYIPLIHGSRNYTREKGQPRKYCTAPCRQKQCSRLC